MSKQQPDSASASAFASEVMTTTLSSAVVSPTLLETLSVARATPSTRALALRDCSPEQLADQIKSLGEVYEYVATALLQSGVDGATLLALQSAPELDHFLTDLGVSNMVHRKVLATKILEAIKNEAACDR